MNLTNRQKQVLSLTAEGMTDKEIALALGISCQTVKNFQTEIRYRMGAKNRVHAILILLRGTAVTPK